VSVRREDHPPKRHYNPTTTATTAVAVRSSSSSSSGGGGGGTGLQADSMGRSARATVGMHTSTEGGSVPAGAQRVGTAASGAGSVGRVRTDDHADPHAGNRGRSSTAGFSDDLRSPLGTSAVGGDHGVSLAVGGGLERVGGWPPSPSHALQQSSAMPGGAPPTGGGVGGAMGGSATHSGSRYGVDPALGPGITAGALGPAGAGTV
jgi:hypothetical protein